MINVGNYDFFKDDAGTLKAVNLSTGEVIDAVEQRVPIGSSITTPDMKEAYREYRKMQEKNQYRKMANKELGDFFFVPNNQDFSDLLPQTAVRLIFLNTYADYGTNKLMLKKDTPMMRRDLMRVLKISKAAVSKFWQEVSTKYIIETEDGLMFTNTDVFLRRKLKQRGNYIPLHKLYIKGVRKVYNSTEANNHKHLGYIFQMLPYINLEFNLLCYNPLETDLDKVQLMSLADFCKEIDYNVSNLNRLMLIYRNLRFDVNNIQERFCSLAYDGIDRTKSTIAVNPHILYNGSDYQKVEVLGAFCR